MVLHTVLASPTAHQRRILEELTRICTVVVTMTQTARQCLVEHYPVEPDMIRVIPHGAVDNRSGSPYGSTAPAQFAKSTALNSLLWSHSWSHSLAFASIRQRSSRSAPSGINAYECRRTNNRGTEKR